MKLLFFVLAIILQIKVLVQEFTSVSNNDINLESKFINDNLCEKQLDFFLQSFKKNQLWALKFYDTWAKIQSGLFSSNFINFGDYDQCVRFKTMTDEVGVIEGKHCFVTFSPIPEASECDNNITTHDWCKISKIVKSLDSQMQQSLCMPVVCSEAKVVEFLSNDFQLLKDFNVVKASCKEKEDLSILKSVDVALISIFSISIILMLASTIYDINEQNKENPNPNKLYIAFSVYTNGKKLFDMSESKSSINSLHGLRAISILWIMFGHRIISEFFFPIQNGIAVLEFNEQIYSVIYYAYSMAVDTFFLMAALLLTISTLRAIDNNTLNILRMIIHRYLRYTPVVGVTILCQISLPRFLLTGPFDIKDLQEVCEKYWWSTLLHIQNYVNPHNVCIAQTWYLSVDFQLFIISPFLIYIIKKYRIFKWLIPALIVGCSIYIFIVTIVYDLSMLSGDDGYRMFRQWIYLPTHARFQSWLIGIALGFYFYEKRNVKVKINSFLDAFLWILSLSMILTIILLTHLFEKPVVSENYSQLGLAFFLSLFHIGWALAIAYIIFACEKLKSGSVVRWFLSHSYWKPIGTMGLSVYVTHVLYIILQITIGRQPFHFSTWIVLHNIWGDFFACISIASFFYLAFETPYLIIENYIYKKFTKSE